MLQGYSDVVGGIYRSSLPGEEPERLSEGFLGSA